MRLEKLYPECKYAVWGGEKLVGSFHKTSNLEKVAESWELSFHEAGPTKLSDGRLLKDVVTPTDLGKNCNDFPFFPVLAKLIDAKENLSIQVLLRTNTPSKTRTVSAKRKLGIS